MHHINTVQTGNRQDKSTRQPPPASFTMIYLRLCSWLWCFNRINFRHISFECCDGSGTLKYNKCESITNTCWEKITGLPCMHKLTNTPKETNETQDSEGPTSAEERSHQLDDSLDWSVSRCCAMKVAREDVSPLRLFPLADSVLWRTGVCGVASGQVCTICKYNDKHRHAEQRAAEQRTRVLYTSQPVISKEEKREGKIIWLERNSRSEKRPKQVCECSQVKSGAQPDMTQRRCCRKKGIK